MQIFNNYYHLFRYNVLLLQWIIILFHFLFFYDFYILFSTCISIADCESFLYDRELQNDLWENIHCFRRFCCHMDCDVVLFEEFELIRKNYDMTSFVVIIIFIIIICLIEITFFYFFNRIEIFIICFFYCIKKE